MMRKSLLLAALILSAAPFTACQRGASYDPNSAGTFFPLRPSLTWTYRFIDETRGTANTLTDRVIGQRRSGTGHAGEIESEYLGPTGMLSTTILYVPEAGYFTRRSGNQGSGRFLFAEKGFLPELLKPGLSWSNSFDPFVDQPDTFHITQVHRTAFEYRDVVVPAGRFSGCIRVETDALYQRDSSQDAEPLRLKYFDWYAPRVGLVKTLVKQSGLFGSELARVELLKFGYVQPKTAMRSTRHAQAVSVEGSSLPALIH